MKSPDNTKDDSLPKLIDLNTQFHNDLHFCENLAFLVFRDVNHKPFGFLFMREVILELDSLYQVFSYPHHVKKNRKQRSPLTKFPDNGLGKTVYCENELGGYWDTKQFQIHDGRL